MRNSGRFIIVIFFLIFFTGAAHSEKISLITDKYWMTVLEHEYELRHPGKIRKILNEVSAFINGEKIKVDGARLDIVIVELDRGNGSEAVLSAVSETGNDRIILSPLLSRWAGSVSETYPEKRIVGFGKSEKEAGNLSMIVRDYSGAFYEAGKWAARQQSPVFSAFFTGDSVSSEKLEAYRRGWKDAESGKEPEIFEFDDSGDNIIDRFAAFFPEEQESLAVVFAGPLSSEILDRLLKENCRIIAENLLVWPTFDYNSSGSIELSPYSELTAAVRFFSSNKTDTQNVIEAEFILQENL